MRVIRNIFLFVLWILQIIIKDFRYIFVGREALELTLILNSSNASRIVPLVVIGYIISIIVISIFFSNAKYIILNKNSKFNFIVEVVFLILSFLTSIYWIEECILDLSIYGIGYFIPDLFYIILLLLPTIYFATNIFKRLKNEINV